MGPLAAGSRDHHASSFARYPLALVFLPAAKQSRWRVAHSQ